MEEWDYEPHSDGAALERAERVKAALWKCDEKDIVIEDLFRIWLGDPSSPIVVGKPPL